MLKKLGLFAILACNRVRNSSGRPTGAGGALAGQAHADWQGGRARL